MSWIGFWYPNTVYWVLYNSVQENEDISIKHLIFDIFNRCNRITKLENFFGKQQMIFWSLFPKFITEINRANWLVKWFQSILNCLLMLFVRIWIDLACACAFVFPGFFFFFFLLSQYRFSLFCQLFPVNYRLKSGRFANLFAISIQRSAKTQKSALECKIKLYPFS